MSQEPSNGVVNIALDIQDEELECTEHKSDDIGKEAVVTDLNRNGSKLVYSVDDVPPWHWCILLGFQHYLTMIAGTISLPFILTPALCIEEYDPARSSIISTIIFVSGLVTLLQCTIGVRLPIIQGGTFAFLVPTFAILNLPQWKCPGPESMANMTYEDKTELWQMRMREIQGAIVVSSIFQILLGTFGVVGLLLRFITPLTIAPAITMVGLSLFQVAGNLAGKNWAISCATVVLIILFSQYLRNVRCPLPSYQPKKGWSIHRIDIFILLPVLLTIVIMWAICAILTASDVLERDSPVRTDKRIAILYEAPWFRFPYPGQWGLPTVSPAAVFGMLAGVVASAIESIGDYYACARLAGAKPPPTHAINRGMAIEGFGCMIAGLWGSGNGTTSYSENIGAIAVTKVGSRRVIQAAGLMMLVFGVLSKFGALFITIPEPIIGGIFCVMFGMIAATGISNGQFIDLNSARNLLVLGFSIFFSLVLSQWMVTHPGALNTGSQAADQIITVLLSTSMFVAGVLGFVLDNTIPGTTEERGLTKWLTIPQTQIKSDKILNSSVSKQCTYDLPFCTTWLNKYSWAAYIPFLPSYEPRRCYNSCTERQAQ